MAWSDRDWDDWVRGQPGTFWGEEKQRLSQPPTPAPARQAAPSEQGLASAGAAAPRPAKPARSAEDYVEALVMLGVAVGAIYLGYQMVQAGAISEGVAIGQFFVALFGGVYLINTSPGKRFIRILTRLLRWGLLLALVVVVVRAFASQ